MHRGERRLRINTALWCLILTLLVVIADSPVFDALLPMERWLYDRRCRYCQFFPPPPTDRLVHLDIDDAALDDVGGWPWPRASHSVRTKKGLTVWTRTPRAVTSRRSPVTNPCTPAFVAE